MTEAYIRGAESQVALRNNVAACAYLDQVLNGVTQKPGATPAETIAYEELVVEAHQQYAMSCTGTARP